MKKIVIPTDFSDNSRNAIDYIVELYKDQDCTFYLVNAIYDTDTIIHSSVYEIYRERSKNELDTLAAELKRAYPNANHTYKKIVSDNMLNDEVKLLVKTEGIDLIVMGTQGATGAKEILFGSTTVNVIRIAECPVLAIPEGFSYKNPKHIVFATDFVVDFEKYQLELLKRIAERNHSELSVLHVHMGKAMSLAQENSKKALEDAMVGINLIFEEVENSSVQNAVFSYNDTNAIDLLVMIKNKHSFFERLLFGSEISQIGYHTTFPFLVLPSEIHETHPV